jgi:hypothetical protein
MMGAHSLLAVALGRPNSNCGFSSSSDEGVITGLNLLVPQSASTFGLTDSERTALQDLVDNGGSVDAVVAMINSYRPLKSPITFVRTTDGTISYFGTATDPNMDGKSSSGNKPATYAARITRAGELRTLYPDTTIVGACTTCPSGRKGNSAIATDGPVTDTLPFPTGTIQYIVEWSPSKGAWIVQKDGTISPTPTPSNTIASPPPGCYDSDGGTNSKTYGEASVNGIVTARDACATTGAVLEAVCANGRANTTTLSCPSGTTCSGGACKSTTTTVTSSSCKDSDGGQNAGTYGVASDATGSYADYCSSGQVAERYCYGSIVKKALISCSGGVSCQGGACPSAIVREPIDKTA